MSDDQKCTFDLCHNEAWVDIGNFKLCFSHYRQENSLMENCPVFIKCENQNNKVVNYLKDAKIKIAAAQASLKYQYSKGLTSLKHSLDKAKQLLNFLLDRINKFFPVVSKSDNEKNKFLITEGIELFEGKNSIEQVLTQASQLFIELQKGSDTDFQVLAEMKSIFSNFSKREKEEELLIYDLKTAVNRYFDRVSGSEEEKSDMIPELEAIKTVVTSYVKSSSDKKDLHQILIKLENMLDEANREIKLNKDFLKEERVKTKELQQQIDLEKDKNKVLPLEPRIEGYSNIEEMMDKLKASEFELNKKQSNIVELEQEIKLKIDENSILESIIKDKDFEILSLKGQITELESKSDKLHKESIKKSILESLENFETSMNKQLSSFIGIEQYLKVATEMIAKSKKLESDYRFQVEECIRDLDSLQKENTAFRLKINKLISEKSSSEFQLESHQIEIIEKENYLKNLKNKLHCKIQDFIRLEKENELLITELKIDATFKEKEIESLKKNIDNNLRKIQFLETCLANFKNKAIELNESSIVKDFKISNLERELNERKLQIYPNNQGNRSINTNENPTKLTSDDQPLKTDYCVPDLPNLAKTSKSPPPLNLVRHDYGDSNFVNEKIRLQNSIKKLESQNEELLKCIYRISDLLGLNKNIDVKIIEKVLSDKIKIGEEQRVAIDVYMDYLKIDKQQGMTFSEEDARIRKEIYKIIDSSNTSAVINTELEKQLKALDYNSKGLKEELTRKIEALIKVESENQKLLEESLTLKTKNEENYAQLAKMNELKRSIKEMQVEKYALTEAKQSLTEKLEAKSLEHLSFFNQSATEKSATNYESLLNDSIKIQESLKSLSNEFKQNILQFTLACRIQLELPLIS